MILRMFTISLEPEHPLRFSVEELRSFLNKKLADYSALHKDDSAGFIHRYPALQCKQVKGDLIVTGISQGSDCLTLLIRDEAILGAGENTCQVTNRDQVIRSEPFGTADTVIM